MPKYSNVKPDFQAPGPRVLIEKAIKLENMEQEDDVDDNLEDSPFEPRRTRYYESKKVLGKLYRAIDEHKFFEEVQRQSTSVSSSHQHSRSLIDAVWRYVQEQTALIQWSHYLDFARDVKDAQVSLSSAPPLFQTNLANTPIPQLRRKPHRHHARLLHPPASLHLRSRSLRRRDPWQEWRAIEASARILCIHEGKT